MYPPLNHKIDYNMNERRVVCMDMNPNAYGIGGATGIKRKRVNPLKRRPELPVDIKNKSEDELLKEIQEFKEDHEIQSGSISETISGNNVTASYDESRAARALGSGRCPFRTRLG